MYRPHCVRSVLTTSVKILPYGPPFWLIRTKYLLKRFLKAVRSVSCTGYSLKCRSQILVRLIRTNYFLFTKFQHKIIFVAKSHLNIFLNFANFSLDILIKYLEDITCSRMDMNFVFECSTRYLTSERTERVRSRVEHEKIKFMSTSGHTLFCLLYKHQ